MSDTPNDGDGGQAQADAPEPAALNWGGVIFTAIPIGLWIFTLLQTETWLGRFIIVTVGGFATVVAALLARPFIKGLFARREQSGMEPFVNVNQALLTGLLAGWAAFTVIPEGSTARIERMLVQLVDGQQDIIDRLPPSAPAMAPVLTELPGRWGEPGCDVVWRFTLEDNALTVEIVETLPGLPPYRLLASVTAANGYRLEATGEQPPEARGMAATFTLDDTGAIPRLSWMDRAREVPLVLEPCPETGP